MGPFSSLRNNLLLQVGQEAQEAISRLRSSQVDAGRAVVAAHHLTATLDEEVDRRTNAEQLASELQEQISEANTKISEQESLIWKVELWEWEARGSIKENNLRWGLEKSKRDKDTIARCTGITHIAAPPFLLVGFASNSNSAPVVCVLGDPLPNGHVIYSHVH